MRKLIGSILAALFLAPAAMAMNVVYSGVMVGTEGNASETAKTSTQTYTMDLNSTAPGAGGDVIGAQLVVSSAVIPAFSFTDGTVSTFSITVVSTQAVAGIKATDKLTVVSTSSLNGAAITVNGFKIINNGWRVDVTSDTAVDIATEMNLFTTGDGGFTASTTAASVVTVSCPSIGAWCNGQTLAVNTSSITVSSPTFQGGQDAGTFSINGISKSAGIDYAIGATAAITATNAAAAINADAVLNKIVVSSAPTGSAVFTTTSTAVGLAQNYATFTSSQSALTIGPFTSSSPVTGIATGNMVNGTDAGYSITTNLITKTNHGLTTGYGVTYSTGSNVTITPLVHNTVYFAIPVDANNFKLATSVANAAAGTAIVLTSSRTSTTADSFTLTPQSLSGTPNFTLQGSNDGVNFNSITLGEFGATIASVPFSTPFANSTTLWDLGLYHMRFLRLLFQGPTTGGVAFKFTLNQKNNHLF